MKNMAYKKPLVIAEIGCNHKGEFEIAVELIEIAKRCGADIVKFQKRNNKKLLSEKQYNTPHPHSENSYGETYGAHREFLEFSQNQHADLKQYCEKIDIIYSTSVWEEYSAREIIDLNPQYIKIPSACNNNFELLRILKENYSGEILVSLGMTTTKEENDLIQFFEKDDTAKRRLTIFSCTSGYPVPFRDVSLLEIVRLRELYEERVHSIGFSGHHNGIAIDIAAYTLGANIIERHFTKDRTWKGTDHAASLEPEGLRKLVRDLHASHESLTYKSAEILDIELPQREKLKFKPV